MPKASRPKLKACAAGHDDSPDLEVEYAPGGPAACEPPDPARIAARILLHAALSTADTSAEEAGRDGRVCLILLPGSSWIEAARDEWRSLARRDGRYTDGGRDYWHYGAWVAWAPCEAPHKVQTAKDAERFARDVMRGSHCAGFASDPSWLPPDLVYAADHRLTLLPMTAADTGMVAAELGGEPPTEQLTDLQASLLVPKLLRLARRLGQTSDAYIVKLRDLVERSLPGVPVEATKRVTASASPRAAPDLARLHGMAEAVAWGLDLQRDIAAYLDGRLAWADIDRGCLLSGPSGCGKTIFARALAKSCGVPLVSGSYSEWHGSGGAHQGDLLKSMRRTFATARDLAPCILFIDEVDSFPDRGRITHSFAEWEVQVVNGILAEIDGVEERNGVVLLAACNHPERLDPALIRSGRLDRHIKVGPPDRESLALILQEHLGADLAGEDLSGVALAASGSTGADCERLVRQARRRARSAGREMILADLLAEVSGVDNRSQADLWLAAVHEAGHVVAVCALRPGATESVTLNGRGCSGGSMSTRLGTSVHRGPADIREQMIIMLAGRAAEHKLFGVPSSGSGGGPDSDLAAATTIAVISDLALGFSKDSGMAWRGMPETRQVPLALAADRPLAERIRLQLDEAYTASRGLIAGRLCAVEALAGVLVVRRVLDGPEAEEIVRRSLDTTANLQ